MLQEETIVLVGGDLLLAYYKNNLEAYFKDCYFFEKQKDVNRFFSNEFIQKHE